MLLYISQLVSGLALMLIGSTMAGISTAIDNSPWKKLLCVLAAILLCTMSIFVTVIALKSIFGL